jgi:hypothetical protein
MGSSQSNKGRVYAGEPLPVPVGDEGEDEEDINAALKACKSKLGTRAVDKAVKKLYPPRYIKHAVLFADDVTVATESWTLIVTDQTPAFVRMMERGEKHKNCLSEF